MSIPRACRCAAALVVLLALPAGACARRSLVEQADVEVGNNLIFVSTRVDDSQPLTFILDTGASGMVLDKRRLSELGLALTGSGDATTGGGSVAAATTSPATIRVGRAELPDVPLTAIDLTPLDMATGHRIDGVLGYEFFARFVVEIDYVGRRIRMHQPDLYAAPDGMVALPVAFEEQIPFTRIDVTGASGRQVPARVEIDTGMTGSLTLTRPFAEASRLLSATQPRLRITTGALLPGQVAAEVVRVRGVRLGPFDAGEVVTTVTATAADAGVAGETVGLIGGDLLRRFAVTLDYSRSRLLLNPNEALLEPDEFDMAGISVVSPQPRMFRVRQVIPESPGAEAGVRAGDVLLAIDGGDAAQMTLDEIRSRFQLPGRTYVLRLRRGREDMEVRIMTRRLI